MFSRYISFYQKPYLHNDFRVRQRAAAAASLCTIVLPITITLFVLFRFIYGRPSFDVSVIATVTASGILLLGLFAIRRGFLSGASHLILVVMSAAIWATFFSVNQENL